MGIDLQTKRVKIAQLGLNEYDTPISLQDNYSPFMKNMFLEGKILRKFRGYRRFNEGSDTVKQLLALNSEEIAQKLFQYADTAGVTHLLAMTDTNAFQWLDRGEDSSWACISRGVDVDDCEGDWTKDHANFTELASGSITFDEATVTFDDSGEFYGSTSGGGHVSGGGSIGYSCDTDAADTNIIAHNDFSSVDLTGHTNISGWVRRESIAFSNNPTLVISEEANGGKGGTYVEVTIPDPGINNEWRFFSIAVDLSDMNAAISIGLYNNNFISGQIIYLDEIRVTTPFATSFPVYDFIKGTTFTDTSLFSNNGGEAFVITNNIIDLSYFEGESGSVFNHLDQGPSNFNKCIDIVEFKNYGMLVNYDISSTRFAKSITHAGIGDLTDWVSSSSGTYTLFDTRGDLLTVIKTPNSITLFSELSITIGSYLGTITKFQFDTTYPSLGLIHPRAVVEVGGIIFFIGSDQKIYILSPGAGIAEIGRLITNLASKYLDIDKYRFSFVSYSRKLGRVFFCSDNGSDTIIYSFNLNTTPPSWEFLQLNNKMVDIISAHIPNKNFPFVTSREYLTLALSKDGKIYSLDEAYSDSSSSQMDGVDSTCEYQTSDLSVNEEFEYTRWQEFTFTARSALASSSVVIEYSVDNGSSWKALDESPVYLENNEWRTYTLHFDIVSRVVRIRFVNTSKDLQIKDDMFISFLPEGVDENEVE